MSHSLLLDGRAVSAAPEREAAAYPGAALRRVSRVSLVVVCPDSWVASRWKAKGDILEAILGEIHMKLNVASDARRASCWTRSSARWGSA